LRLKAGFRLVGASAVKNLGIDMEQKECWLPNGQKAVLLAEADGKYFVSPIWQAPPTKWEDGEEPGEKWISDEIRIVDQVFFLRPPIEVFYEGVTAAKAELESLKVQISQYQLHLQSVCREVDEAQARAKAYPQLGLAFDLIDGLITHAVGVGHCEILVKTLDDQLKASYNDRGKVKLLCLFGNPKSQHWGINDYSDGSSSSWKTVEFFKSEQEAKDFACDAFNQKVEEWTKGDCNTCRLRKMAESLDKQGITFDMPEALAKVIAEEKTLAKAKAIAQAEASMALALELPDA
jgi:hypothetical protein